jgi:hypothetical protein
VFRNDLARVDASLARVFYCVDCSGQVAEAGWLMLLVERSSTESMEGPRAAPRRALTSDGSGARGKALWTPVGDPSSALCVLRDNDGCTL